MATASGSFDEFLADIQPFFHRRSLTYVDVGAYQGEMLARLLASPLKIREAHLIEPNAASLRVARQRVVPLFKGNSLNFHAMALGAHAGRVRMAAAKTMTRVLAGDDEADGAGGSTALEDHDDNVFDAECSTLDRLAHRFTDGRVSLLKVDVEGHEDRVLAGAAGLLGGQKVDLVYIEAGMNPQGTQQCYYRRIEDILQGHGYRLFKIYEQHFEWMEDSPLLRRVNLAFMSAAFAERNPYRLTLELNRLHDDLADAQRERDAAQQQADANAQHVAALELQGASHRSRLDSKLTESAHALAAAEAQRQQAQAAQQQAEAALQAERLAAQAAQTTLADAVAAAVSAEQRAAQMRLLAARHLQAETERGQAQLRLERDALLKAQSRHDANLASLAERLSHHEARCQQAETSLQAVFSALSDLQRRSLGQQADAAQVAAELDRLLRSRKLRLAKVAASHARSPRGWLKMPLALWQAARTPVQPAPATAAPAFTDGAGVPLQRFSLNAERPVVSLALSVKAQVLQLPKAGAGYEVWLQVFTASARQAPVMGLLARSAGTQAFDAIDIDDEAGTASRLPADTPMTLPLRAGPARCWLRVPAGQPGPLLALRRLRGDMPVLKLTLQAPTPAPGTELAPPALAAAQPVAATGFSSEALEMKLWGGYAAYALPALEARKLQTAAPLSEREDAAWSLLRWYLVEGEPQRALDNAEFTRRLVRKTNRRLALAEAQCLLRLGRPAEAEACLQAALKVWPERAREYELFRSTVIRRLELQKGTPLAQVEALQLDALNAMYRRAGLAVLQKRDASKPLELSNLAAPAEPKQTEQGRKVSVVIPAYNAEDAIESVIDSLLRQTWRHLEIIVVDDCSSDGTCAVVERLAALDARVRLVRKPVNEGAYATRNAGARLATGHYITVHDSDDWSHPQKIETQIAWLDAAPGAMAVTSHWVRMGEHLEVVGPWVAKGSLFDVNFSSLLFERRLLDVTGLWDPVKISGDAEFVYRLRALYGEDTIAKVPSSFVLSLSMVREDSLTRAKATHLRSLFHGLRWNYRDAYLAWLSRHAPGRDAHPVDADTGRRRFPLPMGMRPGRAAEHTFDLVVVADFAEPGEALSTAIGCLRAATASGQRAAAWHWRHYERPARTPLQPAFYDACLDSGIEIASPGDQLRCKRLVVCEAGLLQHRIEPAPQVQAGQVVVVMAEPPPPPAIAGVAAFDPQVARAHLSAMFGSEGHWLPAPIDGLTMAQIDSAAPDAAPQTLTPS